MQKKIMLLFLFLTTTISFSQEKFTLSGIISDLKNNETLIGVNLFIPEIKAGIVTNEYGFYSITIPKGTYSIQISYVGYETKEEIISLTQNIKKNIELNETGQQLEEVIINTEKTTVNIRKPEMSVNRFSTATIKKIPVVLGEVDIIRALLTLPGVTNAGEGQSGFNVRGGGADQNLILLDEATSVLDSISEAKIQTAIDALVARGTAVVVIAHRLSTVVNSDEIVVIDKGRVVERGTHKSLIKQTNSLYCNLYNAGL